MWPSARKGERRKIGLPRPLTPPPYTKQSLPPPSTSRRERPRPCMEEEVREKNMYKTVDKTIYKQAFNPEPLIRCWNECLDKSSFHSRRMQVAEFNKKNYWRKRGLAVVPMKFSVGFAATSFHQVRLIYVGWNPHVRHPPGPVS
nr:PREDICTED: aldehyde oxidase 2-like isoform X1 [Equus przewalskii]